MDKYNAAVTAMSLSHLLADITIKYQSNYDTEFKVAGQLFLIKIADLSSFYPIINLLV